MKASGVTRHRLVGHAPDSRMPRGRAATICRLEIGRPLILDHKLGIAEAGCRVCFNSAAAFTAAYGRHFGPPPSAKS